MTLSLIAVACGSGQASGPIPTLGRAPTLRPPPTPTASLEPTETLAATASANESTAPTAEESGGSPAPTPIDLTPYLTSSIDIVNVADDAVDVDVGIASQDSSEVTTVATYHLEPFDSASDQVVATVYRITITHSQPGLSATTCNLNVEDGDQFELAVAAELVTIVKIGYEPAEATELVASTSSLCKG